MFYKETFRLTKYTRQNIGSITLLKFNDPINLTANLSHPIFFLSYKKVLEYEYE